MGPAARLLVAVGVGAALRLWNLGEQILLGDELHAVRSALDWDLRKILTTYRLADNSIPFTAYLHLVVESGGVLTEWVLRLPSLVAGISLVGLVGWVQRREVGGRSAILAAWLAALSPCLVYYSRIARPYAVITLLGFAAFVCFWRFWEDGLRWRWALGYAVSAAGAAWFHLGAAPFVAAPIGFAVLDLGVGLRRGSKGHALDRLRRLAAAGGLLAVLVAAFIVPGWTTFLRLLEHRPGSGPPGAEAVLATLALQAGTRHAWLAALVWLTAFLGLVRLLRHRTRFGLYSLSALGGQWLAIALVLQPTGVVLPTVLNRYLLVALPVVVLWAAVGLLWLGALGRLSGRGGTRWIVPGAAVVLLAALGPYAEDPGLHFGPFAGSNTAIQFYDPDPAPPPEEVPAVYRLLAAEPGEGAVLHAPSETEWWRTVRYLGISRVHGREVVLASHMRHLEDPRLALRNLVPLDPERFLESRARFVAVDLDPKRALLGRKRTRVTPTVARELRAAWGEPHFVDGSVLVWDLYRLRPPAPPA